MADAFSCGRDGRCRFPAAAMLAMAAAAAGMAREDAAPDAAPALAHSSFFGALPLSGDGAAQLDLVLELDVQSSALVISSQLPAAPRRAAHLQSQVVSGAPVRMMAN